MTRRLRFEVLSVAGPSDIADPPRPSWVTVIAATELDASLMALEIVAARGRIPVSCHETTLETPP